ncbi:MAG TPA: aldehyde dehydrogenase family protein, partial [Ilumatobacteraceae bacterium]
MRNLDKIYINGCWIASKGTDIIEVFDSLTEVPMATIPSGVAADVDDAVTAAKAAFQTWSMTPAGERAAYLCRIADGLDERTEELAELITR